jgi:hypothetical protein
MNLDANTMAMPIAIDSLHQDPRKHWNGNGRPPGIPCRDTTVVLVPPGF